MISPVTPDLYDRAARPNCRDPAAQCRFGCRALEGHVELALIGLVYGKSSRIATDIDDAGRAHGLRPVECRHRPDPSRRSHRLRMARRRHHERADRPRSGDEYLLSSDLAGLGDRVKTDGQRLGAGCLAGADQRARGMTLDGRNHQPVAEHALRVGETHCTAQEAHVEAVEPEAFAAKAAGPARLARIDRHQIIDSKAGDAGPRAPRRGPRPRGRV